MKNATGFFAVELACGVLRTQGVQVVAGFYRRRQGCSVAHWAVNRLT